MASSIIHMAVANEINKVLKRDNDKLLIGSIAPDISKQVGQTKLHSHFLDNNDTNIPNMDRFLEKYKDKLDDDFVMGYYIHLYTDFFWFKYFLTEIYDDTYVGKMIDKYIYNDYTNINTQLLDEYNMDLSIFYNEPPKLDNIIQEIPMDKIQIIIDKASIIIENSKVNKDFVFNIENIKKFIETSTIFILEKIKELNIM